MKECMDLLFLHQENIMSTLVYTQDKLAVAKKDALIMHPGPMNRGVEIDTNLS